MPWCSCAVTVMYKTTWREMDGNEVIMAHSRDHLMAAGCVFFLPDCLRGQPWDMDNALMGMRREHRTWFGIQLWLRWQVKKIFVMINWFCSNKPRGIMMMMIWGITENSNTSGNNTFYIFSCFNQTQSFSLKNIIVNYWSHLQYILVLGNFNEGWVVHCNIECTI